MRKLIGSSLRTYARRFVAGGLAIALGVAFVAASIVMLSSMKASAENAVGQQYSNADLVADPGMDGYVAEDVAAVREVPGVEAAAGIGSAFMRLDRAGKPQTNVAVDMLTGDRSLDWQQVLKGRLPRTDREVALVDGASQAGGVRVGDQVRLTSTLEDEQASQVRVVGVVASGTTGLSAFVGTESFVAAANDGDYSGILIRTADGQQDAVRAKADEAVSVGDVVPRDVAQARAVQKMSDGNDVLGILLAAFGAIACFVAAIVVVNTFSILVAGRTRELALLRCVGGKRRQVFRTVLAEAAVLGVVASLVGLVVGVGVIAALRPVLGEALPVPLDTLAMPGIGLVGAFLIGLVITVVAAFVPALRATRVAPLAALRPELATAARRRSIVARVLGVLLLLGGGAALVVGSTNGLIVLGMAGGAVSFLGVLMLLTSLAPLAIRMLGLPFRGGGVGRLAVDGAVRNPGRTAATTAALLVGVCLISMLTVGAASTATTTSQSLDQTYPVDLAVNSTSGALSDETVNSLKDADGVGSAATVPTAEAQLKADGEATGVTVNSVDAGVRAVVNDRSAFDGLRDGVVELSGATAETAGVADGERVRMAVDGRSVELTAMVRDVSLEGLYVTAADFERLAPDAGTNTVWVRGADGASASAVTSGVETALSDSDSASIDGALPVREQNDQLVASLLLVAVGLLAITVLIALVGVSNTLSLSVLERGREQALLRALGLTKRRVRRMLALEALLMTAVAGVFGVLLGVVYGWTGTMALSGTAGLDPTLSVPYGQLAIVLAVAVLVGLIASLLPARRAARVQPAAALTAE